MKRKIFTLLLSTVLVMGAFAQKPEAALKKASVAPVIDGVVDAVWAEALTTENVDLPFQSEVPTLGASGETTWQGVWTDDGIFVLVTVTDDSYLPAYAVETSEPWTYDKVEVYFDVNYVLDDGIGGGGGQGHYQFAPDFDETKIDGTATVWDDGETWSYLVTGSNYVFELFVPFSKLLDNNGLSMDLSGTIGFDVTVIDRDPADDARKRAVWANIGGINESYSNMDDCGLVTLDGAPEVIYIDYDGITLTGGDITEDNGTVQITAAITPENATNKNLVWSLENKTGMARISNSGLVTAIADGLVTVTAMSTDRSYEFAEIDVNITGQVTTLWEMNILLNGGMDDLDENGKAMYWGGWTDASPGYTMVDGVSVHTPLLTDNVWQYQFSQEGFNAEADVDHIYRFKAWADAPRTFTTDFEDTGANGNNRYGVTNDPRSADGKSEWTFDITTDPTWYTFDVKFTEMIESTVQKVIFMLGHSDVVTYIDSVLLVPMDQYAITSTPETLSKSSVRLYPNPVNGDNLLTIDRLPAEAKVTIFDSVGRKVTEVVTTQDKAQFNVSSYARGVYFVKVNNEPVMKFIK